MFTGSSWWSLLFQFKILSDLIKSKQKKLIQSKQLSKPQACDNLGTSWSIVSQSFSVTQKWFLQWTWASRRCCLWQWLCFQIPDLHMCTCSFSSSHACDTSASPVNSVLIGHHWGGVRTILFSEVACPEHSVVVDNNGRHGRETRAMNLLAQHRVYLENDGKLLISKWRLL